MGPYLCRLDSLGEGQKSPPNYYYTQYKWTRICMYNTAMKFGSITIHFLLLQALVYQSQ